MWALLVPEAMAYAEIAGVPPEAGLYAAPLALIGYAIFGTSRQLNVGPSSTVAIISAAVVAPLAGGDAELYIALTAALAIVTGVMCIVLGLVRGGALANFLSDPVLKGFLVGLAIVVAMGQLDKILGYEVESGGVFYELYGYIVDFAEVQWPTLAVGVVSLALLFVIERWLPKVPGALTVVVLSIVAVSAFGLEQYGVHVVGEIPAGLPPIGFPDVTLDQLVSLMPGGDAVLLVAFDESLAAAKQYANKHGYKVDPNQELIGIGAANVGAGMSSGFVVDGSLSKSAAADEAGQKTQMSSLVVAALVLLTVLFLTPLFQNLAEATLGAIVIHAVWGLIRFGAFKRYWAAGWQDFAPAVIALLGVMTIGILGGLILAAFLSLLLVLARASAPHTAVLGRVAGEVEGERVYLDVEAHPDAKTLPGLIAYRFDAELFFANSATLRDDVLALVDDADPPARGVIIDAEMMSTIDYTGAARIVELHESLEDRGVSLRFARTKVPAMELLESTGAADAIGRDRFFTSIREAVNDFLLSEGKEPLSEDD